MASPLNYSTALDQNHYIPVSYTLNKDQIIWQVCIDLSAITKPRFTTHLLSMLALSCDDDTVLFTQQDQQLLAEINYHENISCHLTLNGATLINIAHKKDTLHEISALTDKLTIFETRMLGQYPHGCLPYPREILSATHYTLTTDLHTHLSSQISAHDLLEAGRHANAIYPVELLELLGINTTTLPTRPMQSYAFTPAASEGLMCEKANQTVLGVTIDSLLQQKGIKTRLEAAMSIPIDDTLTFDDLERRVYRMRNPLSKNPDVVHESILRVAQDYAAQGVRYAELAVTAALKPDWLASALVAITQAEQECGVVLRLLVGMPRSLSPMNALAQLDKIKFIAQHPAIVGVDFLGYEANKTRNFGWALAQMARWSATQSHGIDRADNGWTFRDNFIIRVHAGENGKNPDNVAEVLDIAEQYSVRVRVGHAAYGDVTANVSRAQKLAEKGLLIIEFNPDSNMAMNNIDEAAELPVKLWANAGIPFVLASDGAGIYQTTHPQLLAAGIFAGLEEADMEALSQTESQHVALQTQLYQDKEAAYHALYGNDEGFILAYQQKLAMLDEGDTLYDLASKTPILIAGASGSSWARISEEHQRDITIGLSMLVELLDPEQVYFAMGRVKHEGLGRVLDDAIDAVIARDPDAITFDMVGMLSQHQNMPTLADNINHIVPLSGELMSVPGEMTDLLKTYDGCALYIGGSAFTRDFIKCSEDKAIPFGVMHKVAGASSQKARVLDDAHVFYGAKGMVRQIMLMKGTQIFREGVDVSDEGLEALHISINDTLASQH